MIFVFVVFSTRKPKVILMYIVHIPSSLIEHFSARFVLKYVFILPPNIYIAIFEFSTIFYEYTTLLCWCGIFFAKYIIFTHSDRYTYDLS